ncbi:hypothetical protein [Maribacter sp. 2307ULW6-5]|uniref:hypothetical protein n=1 Tax=Maribacter sp. 2307ULW6-5 TaxID=3386275 RepID=UPI0039BD2D2D
MIKGKGPLAPKGGTLFCRGGLIALKYGFFKERSSKDPLLDQGEEPPLGFQMRPKAKPGRLRGARSDLFVSGFQIQQMAASPLVSMPDFTFVVATHHLG